MFYWQSLISSAAEQFFFYLCLFLVDLIPMLCERAGLPQGTPIAMFEVTKHSIWRATVTENSVS